MKITMAGKKDAEQRLSDMHDQLRELKKELSLAYTMTGDTWHDNPYFDLLRREEASLVKKIEELEGLLCDAEIYEIAEDCENSVNIGSRFKCKRKFLTDDKYTEEVLEIVGHGETDLAKGKIAYDSPVGQNLMGHAAGDVVSFPVPAGMVSYKILCFYSENEKTN